MFLDDSNKDLASDLKFLELKDRYLADPQSLPGFSLIDGLLLKNGKIWVSPTSRFKPLLLREFHPLLLGVSGHRKNFAHAKKDVQHFVA